MRNQIDREIVQWLDKLDNITVDHLGQMVIDDTKILKIVSCKTSLRNNNMDKRRASGAGSSNGTCRTEF